MRFNKYQFSIVTIILLLIIPIYCFNTKVFIDWDALVMGNRVSTKQILPNGYSLSYITALYLVTYI